MSCFPIERDEYSGEFNIDNSIVEDDLKECIGNERISGWYRGIGNNFYCCS